MGILPLSVTACHKLQLDYNAYKALIRLANFYRKPLLTNYDTCLYEYLDQLSSNIQLAVDAVHAVRGLENKFPWFKRLIGDKELGQIVSYAYNHYRFVFCIARLKHGMDRGINWYTLTHLYRLILRHEIFEDDNVIPLSLDMPEVVNWIHFIVSWMIDIVYLQSLCVILDQSPDLVFQCESLEFSYVNKYIEWVNMSVSITLWRLKIIKNIGWLLSNDIYNWAHNITQYLQAKSEFIQLWHTQFAGSATDAIKSDDNKDVSLDSDVDIACDHMHLSELQCLENQLDDMLKRREMPIDHISEIWMIAIKHDYMKNQLMKSENTETAISACSIVLNKNHKKMLVNWLALDLIERMHQWVACNINSHQFVGNLTNLLNRYLPILQQINCVQLIRDWSLMVKYAGHLILYQVDIVLQKPQSHVCHLMSKYGWVHESVLPYCGSAFTRVPDAIRHKDVIKFGLWARKNPVVSQQPFALRQISMDEINQPNAFREKLARLA